MARDYLGALKVEKGDKVDYGVLGMQWGKRRTPAQLNADAVKRVSSGEPVTITKKVLVNKITGSVHDENPDGSVGAKIAKEDIVSLGESSQAKYNRLRDQAKIQGPNTLDEADLKFLNARTEAIAKVNKLNQKDPGWLGPTVKKVRETAAQKVMQEVTDAIAKKYITTPITKALTDNTAAVAKESKTPVDYVGKHRAKKK